MLVSKQKSFGNRINSVSVPFKNVYDMSASRVAILYVFVKFEITIATNLPALTGCARASYLVERNE
jgi:hypothetical protein